MRMDLDPPKILETLRHVTALENLLGSLGPQITAMMSRALSLDKKRPGSSNLLLEDSNAAAILELTKEKLAEVNKKWEENHSETVITESTKL